MKTWQLIGVLVGLSIVVPIGCSYINAGSTVATTPARVITKTFQTNNVISNYEYFRDASQNFEARKMQVDQYKDLYKDEKDPSERTRLRIEMTAVQQACRDLAAEYNSNSLKLNRNVFKGENVPETLNSKECE